MTTKMFSLSCVCMYVSLKKYDIIITIIHVLLNHVYYIYIYYSPLSSVN